MPFDWNGYLEVAENLKTETDGQPDSNTVQAKRRTAISRAYYAVYHIAEDYAIANLGYTPNKLDQISITRMFGLYIKGNLAMLTIKRYGKCLCDYIKPELIVIIIQKILVTFSHFLQVLF